MELVLGPGLVHVDEIPDIDLARPKLVDHVGIGRAALRAHDRAGIGVAERTEDIVRVVAFPAKNVELVLTGGRRDPRGDHRRRAQRRGRSAHKLPSCSPHAISSCSAVAGQPCGSR